MEKLTLDTNVLRDWLWAERKSTEKRYDDDPVKRAKLQQLFMQLKGLRDRGICELGITNRIYSDYHKTPSELPQHIKDMIGPYVSMTAPGFGIPMVIPFAIVDPAQIDEMFQDVFPHSKPGHSKYERNKRDALQLYGHRVAGRDFFITTDRFIAQRAVLATKWNVHVMTLEEYIARHLNPSKP